jgi:hypothetical protein
MRLQDHLLIETRRDFFRKSLGGVGAIALAHGTASRFPNR